MPYINCNNLHQSLQNNIDLNNNNLDFSTRPTRIYQENVIILQLFNIMNQENISRSVDKNMRHIRFSKTRKLE